MKNIQVFSILIFLVALMNNASGFSLQRDTIIITPGHKLLQTNQLHPFKADYEFIRIKNNDKQKIGGIKMDFTIQKNIGRAKGLLVCQIQFGQNMILDSGQCDLKTFQPIYHRSYQNKKKMKFDFEALNISGSVTSFEAGKDTNVELVNHKSAIPLFDSYFEDMIARSLVFKKGQLFKFPEYIFERGGVVWSTGEIVGDYLIDDNTAKKNYAWKVKFFEKNNQGIDVRETTYLINKANRSIISREYKTSNGTILMQNRM